jgi:hypothetical protein
VVVSARLYLSNLIQFVQRILEVVYIKVNLILFLNLDLNKTETSSLTPATQRQRLLKISYTKHWSTARTNEEDRTLKQAHQPFKRTTCPGGASTDRILEYRSDVQLGWALSLA